VKWIYKLENVIAGLMLLFATGLLTVNIILRFFFNSGLPWAEELIRYLFIWITFIGLAICTRNDSNIRVDVLLNIINKKAGVIINILVALISMAFLAFLTKAGVELVQFNIERGQFSPALEWPMYIVYISIPIGCALAFIHYIQYILNMAKQFKNVGHEQT